MTSSPRESGSLRGGVALVATLVMVATVAAATDAAGADGGAVVAQVRASPLRVAFSLRDDSVRVGQEVRAEARIDNIGSVALLAIALELRADRTGLVVRQPIIDVGRLKGGKSRTVSWTICGGLPGFYVLLVRVTQAGQSIDSVAAVLSVLPGGRATC